MCVSPGLCVCVCVCLGRGVCDHTLLHSATTSDLPQNASVQVVFNHTEFVCICVSFSCDIFNNGMHNVAVSGGESRSQAMITPPNCSTQMFRARYGLSENEEYA